jgi:UPF0755 protein
MVKSKTQRNKTKKSSKLHWPRLVVIIVLLVLLGVSYYGYKKFFRPNVRVETQDGESYLYIHTGASFEQVLSSLTENKYLCDAKSFEWMAVKMNYSTHVKPGKYRIENGMSNRALLTMLRAGIQVPVKVVIRNTRFKTELASIVSKQIEADSSDLLRYLNDESFLAKYNFNKQTIPAMFIPNTYEFYWNTSPEEFMDRMQKEYKKFWSEKRLKKAEMAGLSPVEVSTIASIVEEESQKNSERPTIAGVYINRVKKGMFLQADPTVKFAVGDFGIKRILDKHLEYDSPYNTYKYVGLPPGPICIPSISALDAVLNYQKHEYIYFCAKEDFSGYHNFARTLEQHNKNADKYRKALNRNRIWR